MADDPVFLYLAIYDGEDAAREDYEVVKELHAADVIGTYDAAVITKDAEGKVHVDKHEKPTQHGVWTGAGVGAVLGVLFPPSILGSAIVAGAAGGLIGHVWRGLSRSDVKELGELLDTGEAALLVIGKDQLEETLDRELKRATKRMNKEIDADAKSFEKELDEAQATA
jgi:uncharacterized membrane protein